MSSPSETKAILDRLDRAIEEVAAATKAVNELTRSINRETAARFGDDEEWTRMPGKKELCRFSNFSRSKLNRLIADGKVRKVKRAGCAFYSGADVRKLIASAG